MATAAAVYVNNAVSASVEPAVAATPGLRLLGYSAESGGTGKFRIYNGATVAGGAEIMSVDLASNESKQFWCWPGIAAEGGLTIESVSGTIDIELYYGVAF